MSCNAVPPVRLESATPDLELSILPLSQHTSRYPCEGGKTLMRFSRTSVKISSAGPNIQNISYHFVSAI